MSTTQATPARRLALEVTRLIRERRAYAHDLIESRVRTARIPQRERDFAILLILGVTATSGGLDYLLDRALAHGSIKADVRDALRVSAYELIFLHKEPRVAVDQGVGLVRSIAPQAAGFANRVLREMVRMRQEFPFGDPVRDIEALAHQQAFPLWLAERLVGELGFAAAADFMAASNIPAPVFLADLRQGTTVRVAPSELAAWMGRIEAGECIVADASAQAVAALAAPPGPLAESPFLEVGSGRGTKTVLLQHNALRTHGAQLPLFALDLHAFKQDILKERGERYGLKGVTPVVGDATRLAALVTGGALPAAFGGALIDAPCSGTGTLRRHPEIRWRLAPTDVTAMAAQGLGMLKAVASHISPGGSLTYSTCSVFSEENEQVVEAFLASPEGACFEVQALKDTPPSAPVPTERPPSPEFAPAGRPPSPTSAPAPVGSTPYLRTSLTPHSADAHFAVRLLLPAGT